MARGFDAYDNAVEITKAMRPVVNIIKQHDPELAEQAKSATQSIGNNVAEGRERAGRDKRHLFRVARVSAAEVRSTLDQAEAWGYVEGAKLTTVRELVDREMAMLWRLGGN